MEFDYWRTAGCEEDKVLSRNKVYDDVNKNNDLDNYRLSTDDSPEKNHIVKYKKKPNEKVVDSDVSVISETSYEETSPLLKKKIKKLQRLKKIQGNRRNLVVDKLTLTKKYEFNDKVNDYSSSPTGKDDKIDKTINSQRVVFDSPSDGNKKTIIEPDVSDKLRRNLNFDTKNSIESPMSKLTPERKVIDIDYYADILDKLYGKEWKNAIGNKLKKNNDKNFNGYVRSTGVQSEPRREFSKNTERKALMSEIISTSISSDDDDDPFTPPDKGRNVKIKKKFATEIKKPACREDSFIDDSFVVSDDDDTFYLTALTTPRLFDESYSKKDPPKSATTRRAIEICDPDTEDDDDGRWLRNKNNDFVNNWRNKKKLSYSDEENSSTDASECDSCDVLKKKNFTSTPKVPSQKSLQKCSTALDKRPLKKNSFLKSLSESIPIEEAHPNAKKYRVDFKKTKEELVAKLYKLFNENIFENRLPVDMPIKWNKRMTSTAGFTRCVIYYKRNITEGRYFCWIDLSTKVCTSAERSRDTLIHEMCHAASFLINQMYCHGKIDRHHGPVWRAWAARSNKKFPELPPIERCHDYEILKKFVYRCTRCGKRRGRHSKSLKNKRCRYCKGQLELLVNKVTKTGTVLEKHKEPTGFALFVKENYGSVKQKQHGVAHKEIMQILGKQFSAIKIGDIKNDDDNIVESTDNL